MELRDLKSPDVFILTSILSKIGLKEFKELIQNSDIKKAITGVQENEAEASEFGLNMVFEIATIIFNNFGKCEQDIYKLISNLSGQPIKDVMNLDGTEFLNIIVDIIQKPQFKDFLKVAARLLKLEI